MLWDQLLNRTPDSSPFVSFEWFDCLSHFLLHKDPDVLLLYDGDVCVGIVPVDVSDNIMTFITDERVTDLTGFVHQPGYEDDIARELASFARRKGLRVKLYPLEQTNSLVQRLADYLESVTVEEADVNPFLKLPASWDDYLATLTAKLRHELRRKLRRGHGVRLETTTPNAIESLFELMAHDGQKKQFLTPDMRAFFTAITKRFFNRGWLRLRRASLDSTPVAILLAFSYRGSIYLYNMGINPQYIHLSPGIVAIALDIQGAIAEGKKYYDFLRGDEAYKFRFGARTQHTLRLQT